MANTNKKDTEFNSPIHLFSPVPDGYRLFYVMLHLFNTRVTASLFWPL